MQRAGYTDAYARQREAILLRQRDKLAAIETQTKDLDAKLAKGIDPDRFWKSKNTSEQVGLAIAMALGAIGSQMAKGPNYAQDAINASVARDLEAQREAADARTAANAAAAAKPAAAPAKPAAQADVSPSVDDENRKTGPTVNA